MKHLLALIVLLVVGGAEAQTPEPYSDLYFVDAGDSQIKFWDVPECPEGWGRIVIKMPPGYGYETVEIECGLVVEPTDD